MPTYVYKATWVFGGSEHGWKEVLYFDRNDDNLSAAIATVDEVAVYRAKMLGAEFFIKGTGCKIVLDPSNNPINGGSRVSRNRIDGDSTQSGDQYNNSLLTSFYDVTSKFHRVMDLGGIWDSIDVNGGKFIDTPTGWNSKWNGWKNKIQTSLGIPVTTAQGPAACGWLKSTKSLPYSVTNYVVSEDNFVTFTIAGTPFAGVTVGTTTTVRFSKMAGAAKSVLNRLMPVVVTGDGTCQTVKAIACAPFSSLSARMYKYAYSLVKAPIINPEEVRSRQRGRPLLVSVGRRPNRPTT